MLQGFFNIRQKLLYSKAPDYDRRNRRQRSNDITGGNGGIKTQRDGIGQILLFPLRIF